MIRKKGVREACPQMLFQCGHVRQFKPTHFPEVGESVWCTSCNAPTIAMEEVKSWYMRCRKCSYAGYYGGNKTACMCAAARHMARCHHRVETWNTGDKMRTYELHAEPTCRIDYDSDIAPF